jgi:hypothetical protein
MSEIFEVHIEKLLPSLADLKKLLVHVIDNKFKKLQEFIQRFPQPLLSKALPSWCKRSSRGSVE